MSSISEMAVGLKLIVEPVSHITNVYSISCPCSIPGEVTMHVKTEIKLCFGLIKETNANSCHWKGGGGGLCGLAE